MGSESFNSVMDFKDSDPLKRAWLTWALWLAALIVMAGVLFALRSRLEKAHVALGFLVVVLGGSAAGGRTLGIGLALLAFLLFNFLFVTPYYTFGVTDPLDWLVLVAFLTTGIVAAQLLNRAQERARGPWRSSASRR